MLIPGNSGPVYPTDCLTFESTAGETGSFSLSVSAANWNGNVWYSTDAMLWYPLSAGQPVSSQNGRLYLRGSGNSHLATSTSAVTTISLNSNTGVKCIGNIETLLDYQTVLNGNHPGMDAYCFYKLFSGNTYLVSSPELPATTLTAAGCYAYMFQNCTGLVTPPVLPATTLKQICYQNMFDGCTGLAAIPAIPYPCGVSGAQAYGPYRNMFRNCTQLVFSATQTSGTSYYYTGETINSSIFYGTNGGSFRNITNGTAYYTATPILS